MIWEGVAGAISLALLTGLTTLAYKHPAGYARVHEIFWRVLIVVYLAYSIFIFGVKFGVSTIWPYVDAHKFDEARAAGPNLWTFIYTFAIFVALMLYLGFLRYLPKLVGKDDQYVPEDGFVIPPIRSGRDVESRKTEKRSPTKPRSR